MTQELEQTQELQNNDVVVKVTKHPGCRISLEVHVKPEAVKQTYQEALRDVRKEVSVPGFRKGKAPQDFIIKNYTPYIEQQWKDLVLQHGFGESLKLTDLNPLSKEKIEPAKMQSISMDGATFTIQFESWPKAPQIDLTDIHLKPVKKKEVTHEDLERGLRNLRTFHAEWQDVKDRPTQNGDFVEVDLDVIEMPARNILTNYRIHLDSTVTPQWLIDLAKELNEGESRDGNSQTDQIPSSVENSLSTDSELQEALNRAQSEQERLKRLLASLHEKPTQVRLTVKAIKQAKLPELDDDLAKKMGLENKEALEKRMQEILVKQVELAYQEELRQQLRHFLFEKYPFDLPSSLVDQETTMRMSVLQSLKKSKQVLLPFVKADEKDLKTQVEEQVKRFLTRVFLLKPIARIAQTQILGDEVLQELIGHMMMPKWDEFFIFPQMDRDTAYERVSMKLMTEKCEDFLISKAKFD